MTDEPIYKMRLDLNVLKHLGFNLYSNVAAVLSEVVANSWDADSPTVKISIDGKNGVIEIVDSGVGMTVAEANSKYLNVGYDKRKVEGTESAGGRVLMGRKGIGKLSLFSVADSVKVASKKAGSGLHGFSMSVRDIEVATRSGKEYEPIPLDSSHLPNLEKGTWLRLESLHKRATTNTVNALRKRIARRFSVFGSDFRVEINDELVTIRDRDDLSKIQFLWEFDGTTIAARDTPSVVKRGQLSSAVTVDGRSYVVRGWIGSAPKPRDLETDEAGNLNSLVVFARGRLIQENILDRINIGGLFTKYLTGQIEADFLDLDDEADIATSDRQRIIEDDPRYLALVSFLREMLNRIERNWAEWRAEIGTNEVVVKYPKIREWIETLPPKSRSNARRVIGSIQGLSIDDEEKRRDLLRHGLLAFERLRLTESTEKLAQALETQADELLPLILEQDQLEASLYLSIVRSRVSVISRFSKLVDTNAKEKVLQEFLFNHLWLLDPSWERAAGSERMEEQVNKEFARIDAGLELDELKGRLDIKYRTMAGKHVIIELKRYDVVPSVFDLAKQGEKYRSATKKLLEATNRANEPIELVYVLGTGAKESPERAEEILAPLPGRVVTYERLIQGALAAYGEYVEARRKVDVIESLLEPTEVKNTIGDSATS